MKSSIRFSSFTFFFLPGLVVAWLLCLCAAPSTARAAAPTPTATIVPTVTLSATETLSRAVPVRLLIPTLGIDAAIEAVGQDKTGAMAIPKKVGNVAWYALGTAPGEIGNAVMAGHLDKANGSPAVFWAIGKLKAGDLIIVVDSSGIKQQFVVTRRASYPYNAAPIDEIFGFSLRSQLNLITCTGTWNKTRGYSKRLVVYAEAVTQANVE